MLQKNALVLYKNQPALITECGEKFAISYGPIQKSGFETQKVRSKDIQLLHFGPLASLRDVYDFEKQFLGAKPSDSAFAEVWELYAPQDGRELGDEVSFKEIAELLDDTFCAAHAWAFYSFVKESVYFAECSDATQNEQESGIRFAARSAEVIERLREKAGAKEREQENRNAFIQRLKTKKIDLPADAQFMQEVEALALGKTDKSRVLKDAGFSETEENAHKILIETGVWDVSRNPYPTRWGLSAQSASETLERPPEEERLSVPSVAYAIDNAWSADPDDAVCFDGEYLWVHVADPASTVTPGSKIDTAARNRGVTLYLPETTARMLAEESLADYALGLSELSNALSFKIKLDDSGVITESAVYKTRVRIERFTYEQVSSLKTDSRFAPLFSIAEKNIERRTKNGAVFIELPEVHVSADCGKTPPEVSVSTVTQTEAATMIREMMLLAGEAAARFAFKNSIPFPYVSQEEPEIPGTLPPGLAGHYRLRRCMRPRSVGVTPSNHAALGIGMYSQVTSPLRRYSDLIAHQQLRAFIDNKPLLDKDTMLERISAGDAASAAAVKVDRKSTLHWTLVWLLQHPDWVGTGIVVEQRDKATVLLIPELALETQIAPKSDLKLNDEIAIRAARVDIPKLASDFIPAE